MTGTDPFFVVGANRSGTTLLRLMLGAHPRLAVPDELIYFRHRMAGADPRSWRAPGIHKADYDAFVREWLDKTAEALPGLDREDLAAIADQVVVRPEHDLREPYRAVAQAWADCQGKVRWGEKTPGNIFYVDVLLDMFPGARFIHLVRDPRAGVHSMVQAGQFGPDPVLCALNRRRFVLEGGAFLERVVPSAQRTTLQYEDLVQDPEGAARSLCAFLGEPFDPAMLAFHRRSAEVMTGDAASRHNALATSPVTACRQEAWRTELPLSTQAKIDAVSGPIFAAYGYEPTGHALGVRDYADVLAKWAYWQWQTWRHREEAGYLVVHAAFARTRRRFNSVLGSSFLGSFKNIWAR